MDGDGINDTWDDPSFPTKEDLDAVAPDSPVIPLQEPADMLHGQIQRHLKQQGSQRIHQTRQGENF